jgi:transposase-like protein
LRFAGENGLLKQFTKAVLERALPAEMTDHLGYEKHNPVGHKSGNRTPATARAGRTSRVILAKSKLRLTRSVFVAVV